MVIDGRSDFTLGKTFLSRKCDIDSFNVITLNTPELEIWQATYYSPFVWDNPYRKTEGQHKTLPYRLRSDTNIYSVFPIVMDKYHGPGHSKHFRLELAVVDTSYLKSNLFVARVGNWDGRHCAAAAVRHAEYKSTRRPENIDASCWVLSNS